MNIRMLLQINRKLANVNFLDLKRMYETDNDILKKLLAIKFEIVASTLYMNVCVRYALFYVLCAKCEGEKEKKIHSFYDVSVEPTKV